MNSYITGPAIKQFREERRMTQAQLAEKIGVSDKAVSKWETGKGLPDISLVESLAKSLGVCVMELMNGEQIVNQNTSCNVLRSKFYVCPICGNLLTSMGDAVISCCGIPLPPLEAEGEEGEHEIRLERVEDETLVTLDHPMAKTHFVSFLAFVSSDRVQFVKLYPEGPAEARFQLRGHGFLYAYCNRHGLFKRKI
ncbi:MAG: helix-turn-helix domain-containing protein [Candidatus Faecousia sp.]|nr:helix-turn-helix domain-containing protein [Candidatus Faecousia sp.]